MDRLKAKLMHDELDAAVKAVLDKHGLTLAPRTSLRFGDNSLRYGIEGTEISVEADEAKARRQSLEAQLLGLPADVLGKLFDLQEHRFKVVGFNPNALKNKVRVARQPDGREFVIDVPTLRRSLKLDDVPPMVLKTPFKPDPMAGAEARNVGQ